MHDTTTDEQVTPEHILQVGLGFWASKALLSAVELGVFTELAGDGLDRDTLRDRLGLHPRGAADFFGALVALGFLERDDCCDPPRYCNAPAAAVFLDRGRPSYVGGLLEMANDRLYPFWGRLTDALRTGELQNEAKGGGGTLWDVLDADPDLLDGFMRAMGGFQSGNFHALVERFPFDEYGTVTDVGGAAGDLSIVLATRYPHLRCYSLDTASVTPVAQRAIRDAGLAGRVVAVVGDMFTDPLPSCDVMTICNVLVDWDLGHRRRVLAAAHDALDEGGVLLVVENLVDDERRADALGLLMSLNMLIETAGGFVARRADMREWCHEAGFGEVVIEPLAGPAMLTVARR
jgi:SAM-dependent methyltransferase